jgi:hypothetical protein
MADYLSDEGRLSVLEDLVLRLFLDRDLVTLPFGFDKGAILQQLYEALNRSESHRVGNEPPLFSDILGSPIEGPPPKQRHVVRRIDALFKSVEQVRYDQLQTLLLLSYSPAFADQRFRRVVPMSVLISGSDSSDERRLKRALHELASEIDCEIVFERPGLPGSWFKEAISKTKRALTSKEVQDNLQKVQRG